MTALDTTILEASVEALIRQQVAAYERQLRQRLGRKLSASQDSSGRAAAAKPKPKRKQAQDRPAAPCRTPEELNALAERFFDEVRCVPGETMAVHAAKLGLGARQLERPVLRLKKSGRIRTVGTGSRLRYYAVTPRT